jgi:preprotein translocase subunit SecE
MSNTRLFALGLVGIAAFAGFVFAHLIAAILGWAGVADTELLGTVTLSSLLGFVLAVVGAVVAWRNERIQEVGQEIASELKKVTWPSWAEIKAATVAVVVFSLVMAVIIGIFDFFSSKVMVDWIPAGIRWAQSLFA